MDTGALKKFAQAARRQLLEEVAARMEQVLQTDSVEIREKEEVVKELQDQINKSSKEAVIDQVAYTWFNRFCALRYMDVNHYTRIGIVSPHKGFTQPEILQEAKQGVIDDSFRVDKAKVIGLLNEQLPSSNPQQEAYRLLLVGACNSYHTQMPFLFPKIDDYTELLMPDDLLSENSILQAVRETLSAETCRDVEVIGWLYQFYISERKDEVFAALKKNKKIEAEDIPAATQLFTPHWIVRYLVENSLGRLWVLNNPDSRLVEQMDYYIQSEEPETDFLEITSPEEIKVCDPACGSGHMLTYAFDLLYAIYEEQGFDPVQIPILILKNNVYGIEIDPRAGHLAAFAVMMKAREKDRCFFSREVEPNICVLENITFTPDEIENYKKAVGPDLFTQELWFLLQQFEQAENFGSLIRPQVKNPEQIRERLQELGIFNDMFLSITSEKVKQALRFSEFLNSKYHIVFGNPPYKGRGELNKDLQEFMEAFFPKSKGDLFACFIERGVAFLKNFGFNSMVTMQGWLFIDTYKGLREEILNNHSIIDLIQIGFNSFPELNSKYALAAAFTIQKGAIGKTGNFISLNNAPKNADKNEVYFEQRNKGDIYRVNSDSFKYIQGSPISFEASENLRKVFFESKQLGEVANPRQGMATSDNKRFVRIWSEVSFKTIGLNYKNQAMAHESHNKWFPYNKGGGFRKWYGNQIFVLAFNKKNRDILKTRGNHLPSEKYYFKECITWSLIGLTFGPRYTPNGFLFDVGGSSAFPPKKNQMYILAFMASKISSECLVSLNPTLNFQVGDIKRLPIKMPNDEEILIEVNNLALENIEISKADWNRQEISWDFSKNSLLNFYSDDFETTIKGFCNYWRNQYEKMFFNETKLNQLLLEIYQLEGEIEPDIDIHQITILDGITSINKGHLEFNIDVILKEFISYSVGCMLGRYSLDNDGMILASAGETMEDYLRQVPEPSFMPDEDAVIPVLEGEWFEDDIAERFKDFLKLTFSNENFEENLAFLEEAIGRDIRSYFVKDFYNEHVKMYKKRPIYWLFSSPNGSFNALIYMHRYTPDTVSVILNEYLVPYRDKLQSHKALLEARVVSADASQGEKTRASREIDQINKVLSELKEYEDEILYPLATQQIEIDLDDGVLVNYNKFGKALKKVTGLSGKA